MRDHVRERDRHEREHELGHERAWLAHAPARRLGSGEVRQRDECDEPDEADDVDHGDNPAAPVGNQVAALSEAQRNAVFIRALRDAGLACQHVERAVPAGTIQNMPAWRATCQGGGEWTILIAADGNAQILPEGARPAGNAQ